VGAEGGRIAIEYRELLTKRDARRESRSQLAELARRRKGFLGLFTQSPDLRG